MLATHARMSWFAPGEIDCVVALFGFPLTPPAVRSVALIAASIDGAGMRLRAKPKVKTKI